MQLSEQGAKIVENGLKMDEMRKRVPKNVSVKELMEMNLPAPQFVVPGLIPHGLVILAGSPKVGKSWFSLDMALSMAAGRPFLGRKVQQCGVLYLALEDGLSRLQDRARKVLGNDEPPDGCFLQTEAQTLNGTLISDLNFFMSEHPETRLVIIDTLAKIRSVSSGRTDAYQKDYADMSLLKRFADENDICVLLVHHLRKSEGETAFDRISGSNGLLGAADAALVLSRRSAEDETATLDVVGRDLEQDSLAVSFGGDFRWHVVGAAAVYAAEQAQAAFEETYIMRAIRAATASDGRWSGTASDLIKLGRREIGVEIASSSRALADFLDEHREELQKAGFLYDVRGNGSGGKRHVFQRMQ